MSRPFKNRAKQMLQEGKKISSAWAQIASPLCTEILCRAGFDLLILDMEHGPNDIPTLLAQMQVMNGYSAVPVVRAPWNDFVMIKRILDAGAFGVLIPYINTKEEAEAAVAACKYPPAGIRGLAGSTRAAGFGQNSLEYFSKANEEILIIVQVETEESAENIDAILEVSGVDGIFIGPMDLATNMGYIADPSQAAVQKTIGSVAEKVLKSNKFLSTISKDWNQAKTLLDQGYQMVTLMSDAVGLAGLAAEKVKSFEEAFPKT
ncbi:MAG: 2,4-dihydroxyhept-2-ene-1,7-dioic acid aldolase [SAR324 cluster bacterium]|nr:2,4-dihydroxyhept-2-ene-1,7-dioic acid aldolase [SAR324 cluster bacterium]